MPKEIATSICDHEFEALVDSFVGHVSIGALEAVFVDEHIVSEVL